MAKEASEDEKKAEIRKISRLSDIYLCSDETKLAEALYANGFRYPELKSRTYTGKLPVI